MGFFKGAAYGKKRPQRVAVPKLHEIGPLVRDNLQVTGRLLAILLQASPALTLIFSLQSLVTGLLVPAQVFVTAGLIGNIVTSIAAGAEGTAVFTAQSDLRWFVIAWLALQVVPMLFGVLRQLVSGALGENFLHRMNQKLMLASNQVQDLAAFEGENIFNDSAAIRGELRFRPLTFMMGLFSLLSSLIALGTLSGAIVRYAVEIPIIAVALGSIALVLNAWVGRRMWSGNLDQSKHARMMDYVFSLCYSRDTRQEIRIFDLSDYLETKFSSAFRGMKEVMNKMRMDVALGNLFSTIPHIALLVWLMLVIVGVTHQSAAEVTAVVFLLNGALALQGQVSGFAGNIGSLIGSLAYFQKFFSFTDHLEAYLEGVPDKKDLVQIEQVDNLSFDSCTFRYGDAGQPALVDISFSATQGERIAIVGRNGAGKSTLMKLALGLYRPQQGAVRINGTDLKELDVESYWDRCSVCFQDFPKYMFTVGENIAFEDHMSGELPDLGSLAETKLTYDSQLGKEFEGEELSVGQWQRLSVLRCLHFAANRDIVVLDEPTAAIDPLHEDEIFRQFDAVAKGKLAFFVTHRLSIIRYATRILVMEDGRIIDDGGHYELMDRSELYQRMYSAQADKYLR